jgi:hypothetical protein
MKKIAFFLLAVIGTAFKNAPKVALHGVKPGSAVIAGLLAGKTVNAQNIINYTDIPNHKYHLLVTNTVGTTNPSNAVSVFTCSKDTMWMFLSRIKFSGITTGTTAITPSSRVFWANDSKMLSVTDFSLITLPFSQVTGTPGFITSETDPLFDSKFAGKTTTDLIEGSNLYFTAARTRTTISAGTGISYVSGTGVITNSLPDQTVSITPSNTNITVSSAYPSFTVGNAAPDQVVDIAAGNTNMTVTASYPNFTVTPYVPNTFTVTRAINSSTFQPSTTKLAWVNYTIRINCTATIGSASSGTVNLQYSTNNGSTWIDVSQVENSNTVTLAVVLNSNTTQTGVLSGCIPAGAIVRMVQGSSGTTTITYVRGQETF